MEKSGEKAVKPILSFLFILSLFLASFAFTISISQPVSAQSTAQCCVLPSGCFSDADLLANGCQGGVPKEKACSQLPECDLGYCCYLGGPEYKSRSGCDSSVRFVPATKDQDGSDGSLLCDPTSAVIKGKITYSDGTPAKANIDFKNKTTGEDLLEYSATTDADGNYIAYVKNGKTYQVLALRNVNIDSSCNTTGSITVSGDSTFNVELQCIANNQCQMKWDVGPWSDEVHQCGTRTVKRAADNNGCASLVPAKPPETAPCINVNNFVCDLNGTLDEGEACDPSVTDVSGRFKVGSNDCSEYLPGTTGNVTCSSQCIVDTSACTSCPTNPDDCTLNQCTTCATQCSTAPICAGNCQEQTSLTLNSKRVAKELKVTLNWDLKTTAQCTGAPIRFLLDRCDAENGQCHSTLKTIATTNSVTRQFVDQDPALSVGKQYCYNITVEMRGATTDSYNVSSPKLSCVRMPDVKCQNRDAGKFCNKGSDGHAVISECTDEGIFHLATVTCTDACTGPDIDGNVKCIDTNVCSSCNGPFGVFGYTNNMYLAPNFGDQNLDCNTDTFSEGGAGAGICYLDEASATNSAIGQYKACSDVWSCYDYKTSSSCTDDPCLISAANNCNWKPVSSSTSTENDVGLGVCVPADPALQDCTQCDSKSPLGVCTPSVCSQYGDVGKCNYNPKTSTTVITDEFQCMDKTKMSCNSYQNKTDCTGPDNKEFRADITYDNNQNMVGTNDIIQRSDDKYGFGTCHWVGDNSSGTCYKDADMSRLINDEKDGCGRDDLRCLTDFQYPETNISLIDGHEYSSEEIKRLTFTINDNSYSRNDASSTGVETYFSIEPKEANQKYTRPNTKLRKIEKIVPTQPGDYVLYYFSKDPSKNFEPVKNISFTLIKDLSGISVTKKIDSAYTKGPDVFLSNITVDVSYEKQITCTSTLTQAFDKNLEISGNDGKSGTEMNFKYTLLEDGDYNLLVECTDSHLQKFTYEEPINIEADTTIKNPTPKGITVLPGNIKISINTTENAQCYYLNDKTFIPPKNPLSGTIDSKWTKFSTTGQTYHEATVTRDKLSFEEFFTACKFNYTSPTPVSFIGNYGDMIYFGVDNESPKLKIIDDETKKEYNSSTSAKESVDLTFECNDTTHELSLPTDAASIDLDFGCDSMSYCEYYSANTGTGCTPTHVIKGPDVWKQTFTAENGKTKIYLNISVADKGGNTRNYENVLLNIKNTTFIPPNITICSDASDPACSGI